ncbi:tryptophan ABC transporter substrate-binding protein [Streptococcus caprae]|uniref:Tryptophan ABC transporter substrate-binding protein n=1 Tax=Streptococcus caprae TaxID=1640501 RepID=A0ABV8CX82_9STRE
MKNKGLLAVLAAIVILVCGAVFFQNKGTEDATTTKENTIKKVGVLQFVTHEALDEIYRGIQDGLAEAGYSGDNVEIDFLNSEADQSKVQTMSQQLVSNGNDVLIGIATPAAQGLASATSDIPVIMGAVTDPVGANLVSDLKHPDKNITGVSDVTPIDKQVELMQELTPNVKTVGVIYSSSEDNSASQVAEFKELAAKAGYTVEEYSVPSTNEIATSMSVMVGKVDAIWLPLDNTVASAFSTVVQAAKEKKIPIYTSVQTMVEEGGLASVAIDQYQLGVSTGKMAARILAGQTVAENPVEVVTEGSPVINIKVAAELGLTVPDSLLKDAQVVE